MNYLINPSSISNTLQGFVLNIYSIWQMNEKNTCDDRILEAKKKVFSCSGGQKLWDAVASEGAFTIKCATREKAPMGAMVLIKEREIFLSETNKQMSNSLLFELHNLKQAKLFTLLIQNMCSLKVDDYALAIETIEFDTAQKTDKLYSDCFNDSESVKFLENFNDSSEEFFKKQLLKQENDFHTDYIRKKWYEVCDPEGLLKWTSANLEKWNAARERIQKQGQGH